MVAPACGGDESSTSGDTKSAKTTTGKAANAAPAKPSLRKGKQTFRSLLDEAPRAELDAGGVLIDMGGPDQYKFTRGDWRTGWGNSKHAADGVNFTAVPGRKASVELYGGDRSVVEIVARLRSSVPGQRASLMLGGRDIGSGDVGGDWTEIRAKIPDGVATAGKQLQVSVLLGKPAKDVRAEVDWIWLRSGDATAAPAPLPRVVPIDVGKRTRRSLPAPSARTYSFYLQVPDKSHLVFDYGADGAVPFEVSIASDGATTAGLWSGTAKAGEWTEAAVDLSAYAGKAVRLDLTTSGAPAKAGWGEPEIMVRTLAAPPAAGAKPKNVILLVIDTVRADAFAPFDPDSKVYAPTVDALAKDSIVFEHAYNQENWTKPSVATTLTGLYPATHDTKKDPSVLPDGVEMLSERLKKDGFSTAGFVANGFVSDKFGFKQGWDHFRNYIRERKPSEAETVFGDALTWLDTNQDKRFFLYLQTIDPHVVYRVDQAYWKRYYSGEYKGVLGRSITAANQVDISKGKVKASADDKRWLEALYFGEISYHDDYFGRFIAELKQRGLYDNSLIVVTNDHGEELGEHGRWGHGHSLYEELLRAPMMMRHPGALGPARRVSEVVENVDVAPTIVDALGLAPLADADGASLVPLLRGEPVQRPYYAVAEFLDGKRAIRVGNWKMERGGGTYIKMFDLTADPGEMTSVADTLPIARRLLEVHFGEAMASPDKRKRLERPSARRRFEAGEAEIDPALRRQLEALGYFGG